MCNLCDSDIEVRVKEANRLREVAARMERLARHYNMMANGQLKPHSQEAVGTGATARAVIRDLVEDWV